MLSDTNTQRERSAGVPERNHTLSKVILTATTVLVILAVIGALVRLSLLLKSRMAQNQYQRTRLGKGPGHRGGDGGSRVYEMSGKKMAVARHQGEAVEREDDFLPAEPRKSGSGSRAFRSSGRAKIVSRMRNEEEGEEDEEFGLESGETQGGTSTERGRAGAFGRLLSQPGREGFDVLEDIEDEVSGSQRNTRLGYI